MTQFDIPDSKTIYSLDIDNIGGCDEYSSVPLISRSPDMENVVNRLGMHQVRSAIKQNFIVGPRATASSGEDDIECNIKWVGKIEEYDDLGNPIPYYIKISEHLGTKDAVDESYLYISVWATPDVKNIAVDMTTIPGCENYRITYKKYNFTNYGETGNRCGLYEDVDYDGKTYVFTPIGILSFTCSTTVSGSTKTLNFDVSNVLDNPYVPIIMIACSPDGTNTQTLESVNLLTNKRTVQFISDGTSTLYKLPERVLMSVDKIKQLNSDGSYSDISADDYTVDLINGTVTFDTAPAATPITGHDNIIITYTKNPLASNETNNFDLTTSTNNNFLQSTVSVSKTANASDKTKIDYTLAISVSKGSAYTSSDVLTAGKLVVKMGTTTVYTHTFTSAEVETIKSGTLSLSDTGTISNTGERNWSAYLECDVTTTKTVTNTTTVTGKVGSSKSFSNHYYTIASYLKFVFSAKAVGHVGTKTDGSDSYWDITVTPRLKPEGSIYASGCYLYGRVDGSALSGLHTGKISSAGTYPSSGSVTKRIYYSAGKTSVSISMYAPINITWSGTYYGTVYSDSVTLTLPTITLPSTTTTTTTTTTSSNGSNTVEYTETIGTSTQGATDIIYENDATKSARLACYYATKAATVYGYENDRRVFITNGTSSDTFSGNPKDDAYGTLTYFPDDNYHVLGEESDILGYAQDANFLYTFKEGDDSVYIRHGSYKDSTIIFPSYHVSRNLQVLCRPIEIDGAIFVITRNGLEQISYDSASDYNYNIVTYLRSYYVSNYFKLGSDYKYKQMQWYYENGLLHVLLDNYDFVFDVNSKSYVKTVSSAVGTQVSSGLPYQFECYVCTIPNSNANVLPPRVKVYLPKDFERLDYGIVNTNVIPMGYSNNGIYRFEHNGNKVDVFKSLVSGVDTNTYYPIKAHYYTPFIDFDNITQLKTTKQIHINTDGTHGNEYNIGYVLPDGSQLLLDKILNSSSDTKTEFRNSTIPFPKILAIRNKIRKFTNVKLFLRNKADYENIDTISASDVEDYCDMTFDRITIQYVIAGKYRGD